MQYYCRVQTHDSGAELRNDEQLAMDPADPTPAIEAEWQNVRASWGDETAHKKFIALAHALNALPLAGRRYRELGDADETLRTDTKKHIDAIQSIALRALIEATPRTERKPGFTFNALMIVLCVATIIACAWLWLRAHQGM